MEIVLSQFWIFTVFKVISCTMPSAVPLGKVTQSPMRSMSLTDNCMPATNPRMLSLNTNISTAADAPSPAKSFIGDLSINTATIRMPPRKNNRTCKTWTNPFRGRFFWASLEL